MERVYRTVVKITEPAYTTAWGVRREALAATHVYGPFRTRIEANDVEDQVRASSVDDEIAAVVQVAELDWQDVTE